MRGGEEVTNVGVVVMLVGTSSWIEAKLGFCSVIMIPRVRKRFFSSSTSAPTKVWLSGLFLCTYGTHRQLCCIHVFPLKPLFGSN